MFSSVQDDAFEIRDIHMRPTLLSEVLPNVVFETVPMLNPFKFLTKRGFSSIVLFYTDVNLPLLFFLLFLNGCQNYASAEYFLPNKTSSIHWKGRVRMLQD